MNKLLKIIWFIIGLFKPRSADDQIKIKKYQRKVKQEDTGKEMEEDHATLEEQTKQALNHWFSHPTHSNYRKYIKLLKQLQRKSAAIQRHDARNP